MSTVEEVEAATRQFNGYELDGRKLRVNSRPPPSKGDSFSRGQRDGGRGGYNSVGGGGGRSYDSTNKVYVGNLPWSVDNLALETLFQEQGNVMEARVVYDRDSGRSKGFGFVTYGSMDEVNKAIDSMDGLGSCYMAYVILKDSEPDARTVDILHVLLNYALDPAFVSDKKPSVAEIVEASANKLLLE